MKVGGMILCGGQSKRMGRAKADLPFGDETLLSRVAHALAEAVDPVIVVSAPDQQISKLPSGVQLIRDATPGRGPLQGFADGLAALPCECSAAFVSSCDVPFLLPAFVRRMIDLLGDADAVVPEVGGRRHGLAGVYRTSIAGAVQRLLAKDELRFSAVLEIVGVRLVGASELIDVDPELLSLWNVNTPEDYAAALRRLAAKSPGQAAQGPVRSRSPQKGEEG
jgi:molybdopterin-guanine dinucleotide biosynthesis protein A